MNRPVRAPSSLPGSTAARVLRFGVRDDLGRHSQPWKVKADAGRPDFYVSSRALGASAYVSLHEHPDWWRIRVNLSKVQASPGARSPIPIARPSELLPGYTRAVEVRIPSGAVDYTVPTPPTVRWFPRPDTVGRWVLFNVFIERARADPDDWPGRANLSAILIGRVPLADGGAACVTAHVADDVDSSFTLWTPDPNATREVFRRAANPVADAVVFEAPPEGGVQFTQLRFVRMAA